MCYDTYCEEDYPLSEPSTSLDEQVDKIIEQSNRLAYNNSVLMGALSVILDKANKEESLSREGIREVIKVTLGKLKL